MSGPLDVGDLISLLETSDLEAGQQVKELVLDNLRSTKEVWLVNALIDSYVLSQSTRCLDIIVGVSDPHHKHVFDRILEYMRGPNKLAAMTMLATLVYKQPAWLHTVIGHSVFNQLLKCLKTDTDVPVLLSGLLVITALLPVVPVAINQYLPHIFEVFSRLATFCLKAPANVSELYKYHLKVGVYCLHSRLYGMFPYHFLTYLRNIYSRHEQQQVFEHVIKPMVDKLRLHPLLFTTSREKEVSRDRWRQKEVHDILVECAQFSLDLTEGSTTEMSTPGPQKMADHLFSTPKLHSALSELAIPSPGSLVAGVDPTSVLSHQRADIMAPPSGQETPSIISQGARGPTPINQGSTVGSPAPETEKTPILANSDKFQRPASIPKPTTELGPSNTSETARPESQTGNLSARPESQTGNPSVEIRRNAKSADGSNVAGPASRQVSRESGEFIVAESLLEASLDRAVLAPASELEAVPSVTQLPKFLDSLDNQAEDTDHEVTEITTLREDDDGRSESSDTPSHLPAHLNTAESVAAFMKKVNRLRFNSINISRESSSKLLRSERSRSCPNLDPDKDQSIDNPTEYRSSTLPKQKVVLPRIPSMTDSHKKMTRCNSSQTSLYALSTVLLDRRASKSPGVPKEMGTEIDLADPEAPFENFPYQELFSMSLPFSPYVQCYSCVMNQGCDLHQGKAGFGLSKSQPALDDRVPLFSSYSPAELLDRILDQGHMIHDKDKALIAGTKLSSSACTDVAVLHGQIDMLHNQLMFERHKRELHAQRNRRLLSRIVKTTALEEQNNAMKDQLQLQERELLMLRKELTQQQKVTQQLQQTTTMHEADTEKMSKSYNQTLETLRNHGKDLGSQLEEAKAQKERANKEVQSHKAQVYTLTKEVEALTKQSLGTNELKEKVKQLNKELLLMGELQQKYQSRLVALNTTENSTAHMQFLVDTYKVELNSVKNSLGQKTIQSEGAVRRLEDCLNKLQIKNDLVENLKHEIETIRDTHSAHIESVESKYQALKKSHLALQTEFLTLNHQLGCLKAVELHNSRRPSPRHGPRATTPIDAGGASVGAAGSVEWAEPRNEVIGQSQGGELRTAGCPAEWSAPASVASTGSVESAEEAVAMDTSQ